MTIDDNKAVWDNSQWLEQGEEWSEWWGTSAAQWYWTILPRIYPYLPAGTILEIAPGCGRWTKFLIEYCKLLIGVDLTSHCIDVCRERFPKRHLFFVNDGKSLDCVADGSIDFCFSYDSLVHCDDSVIVAYLEQLARKLRHEGVAFLHHSNAGANKNKGIGGRDPVMTAEKFAGYCQKFGLACVSQELVDWSTEGLLTDCHSIIRLGPSCQTLVVSNPGRWKDQHLYASGITAEEIHKRILAIK